MFLPSIDNPHYCSQCKHFFNYRKTDYCKKCERLTYRAKFSLHKYDIVPFGFESKIKNNNNVLQLTFNF